MQKRVLTVMALLLALLVFTLHAYNLQATDTIDAAAVETEQVEADEAKQAAQIEAKDVAQVAAGVEELQKEIVEQPEYIPSTQADEGYISELRIMEITAEVGNLYNISPELLQAICWHESRYYIAAENGTCKGLMQLNSTYMAERMEKLEVTDIYDEYSNVLLAADYIAELRDTTQYGYDLYYVLMRYNMTTDTANRLWLAGEYTDYAIEVTKQAAELERLHGK